MLTSLFPLLYVTREFHRFLHRGWAKILVFWIGGRLWEVVAHGGSIV